MRTTITLDDDLAEALKERARRERKSFKAVINAVLRAGLTSGAKPPRQKRFKVKAARRGFQPGIDPLKLNQLLDELETERFMQARHDA